MAFAWITWADPLTKITKTSIEEVRNNVNYVTENIVPGCSTYHASYDSGDHINVTSNYTTYAATDSYAGGSNSTTNAGYNSGYTTCSSAGGSNSITATYSYNGSSNSSTNSANHGVNDASAWPYTGTGWAPGTSNSATNCSTYYSSNKSGNYLST